MGRASTSSSSSGFFGCISPRSATLAIAILGIIIHLNTYSWLGALTSSLPDVPERAQGPPPPASAAFVPSPDKFVNSAAKAGQLANLEAYAHAGSADGAGEKHVYLPEWVAEAKAYLKAQGLSEIPTQGNPAVTEAIKSTPNSRPVDAVHHNDAADPAIDFQVLDDGAEDVERMQWEALRLVIGTLRWYIVLSVVCCCAGVIGVLRSQLLLSRLFVIHSFLDFLLSTLSLFALAIVCTYPSVRAHLCDEFGSGEVQAWFSSSRVGKLAGVGKHALANAGSTPPAVGVPGSAAGSDVTVVASGWETLLDGVFASENCEERDRKSVV